MFNGLVFCEQVSIAEVGESHKDGEKNGVDGEHGHQHQSQEHPADGRLFKMTNLFAQQIRRVADEDKEPLEESGLSFNIHALIGGQLENDRHHRLYLVYPQGNWVEIGEGTPYHIIGASGYGKPVLDRTLKYDDPLRFSLKVGCLAFDSTRISAADVDFPIDIVVYLRDSHQIVVHRYGKHDLTEISEWWQERLRNSKRGARRYF